MATCKPLFIFIIPAFAIRCYQCSSATDMKGVDSCGAYKLFNRTQHIAIECNSDESHMPGSFCMKVVNQSPRGFICEFENVSLKTDPNKRESFQGMADGDKWSEDVRQWLIQASLESVIGAYMKMACTGRSVTVPRMRVTRETPKYLEVRWCFCRPLFCCSIKIPNDALRLIKESLQIRCKQIRPKRNYTF